MTEESSPDASHAPFSIVAISALLWSQGAIWAGLGIRFLYLQRWLLAYADIIAAVFFAFAVLSWVLAVRLPRRGSAEARLWIIGEEIVIALFGTAILAGTAFAGLGIVLFQWVVLFFVPLGLFDIFGIFLAACTVADLLFGSARDYCLPRAASG